ncbi:uncharacterized protein C8Q71DRAFT_728907 [Rhodofomes roseus]|uniref:Uncharacterized protein n=1 Tax=Rhodofomes roseus TaxID=34475 RepID=A0ABQ8KXD4_9APHY|nr:uncharacterized protein C8Q71DRAFT_728907 [Rhodofomes roseus]KAH9843550.1 hypothetical protein C8Q71DRAFT_728907 [Rhodofomes roseus]
MKNSQKQAENIPHISPDMHTRQGACWMSPHAASSRTSQTLRMSAQRRHAGTSMLCRHIALALWLCQAGAVDCGKMCTEGERKCIHLAGILATSTLVVRTDSRFDGHELLVSRARARNHFEVSCLRQLDDRRADMSHCGGDKSGIARTFARCAVPSCLRVRDVSSSALLRTGSVESTWHGNG